MNKLLTVHNLSTKFKTERGIAHAVRFVNFSIDVGEIMGLVGESGSGKSVTAKSIMRLIDKSKGQISGKILLEGEDLLLKKEKEMQSIRGNSVSMIFQDPMSSLNPLYSVGEQIAEVYRYHKKMKKKAAKEATIRLMEQIGIPAAEKRYSQYPHEFSGGMLQRIMIAIALACNPRLLIADEPTTALDVTIQAQILRLLKRLQGEFDMGILLITHDLGVVAEICDRVSVMYAGEIVESGDVETIFRAPMHPYTLGLIASIPKLGSKTKMLSPIEGAPPDLHGELKGCPFAERCAYKTDICLAESPELREVEERHIVGCHHVEAIFQQRRQYA
ncbi:ABC transporter ATP-binding protein [Sporosarcina sp. 179-K 3D1 HS]|uniref:ABC transporter ATP-binding protein n=1 Tax=Sporosarcina sp. 179-K 3D1 HS TaxID=3232169 RepID=UPI0039A2EB11